MPETIRRLRTKTDTSTPDTSPATAGDAPSESELASMPIGCNRALIWLHMVDASGERLEDNGTTVDVTIYPVGTAREVVDEEVVPTTLVGDTVPLEGWSAIRCIDVAMPAGVSFWVGMGALASPPAGTVHTRVYWLPYRA